MESLQLVTGWNPALYDEKHSFVFKYGEDLVDLLQPKKGERILDLGCGTGFLTQAIATAGAEVIGIDHSAEMVGKAQLEYPHLDFRLLSCTDFHFERQFDAVFSNAVLHWVLEKEKAIDCMYRNLKRHGRVVLEFGGKGNVEQIAGALRTILRRHGWTKNAAISLWYFPSISEYTGLLEQRGFEVTYAALFQRETKLNDPVNGIKDWIKMFGTAFLQGITTVAAEQILDEVQERLHPVLFKNGSWWADYKRIRIIAIK
jgi:trans-aconitate methyltransferase